jgi:hypothetical protein
MVYALMSDHSRTEMQCDHHLSRLSYIAQNAWKLIYAHKIYP